MRLLLDTHALIWSATSPVRASPAALEILAEADLVFVSSVTAYEMVLKFSMGKLPIVARLMRDLSGYLEEQRYQVLPVGRDHAEAAGRLPLIHRDPFDRLLVAQALTENLTLVSSDAVLDALGVRRLW